MANYQFSEVHGSKDGLSAEKQKGIYSLKELRASTETILKLGKAGDYKGLERYIKELRKKGSYDDDAEVVKGFRDSNQRTFIHFAAAEGKTAAVRYVLEKVAPDAVSWTDAEGAIPLHYAVSGEHLDAVQLLLEKGSDICRPKTSGTTPLQIAAQTGNAELVRFLLDRGADINALSDIGTALHWAVREGAKDVLSLLLERGADANKSNPSGATPLALAVVLGNSELVGLLVRNGADVTMTAPGGLNALHIAAELGHLDVIQELLTAEDDRVDAALRATSDGGLVPLQLAAVEDNREIVELLMKRSPFLHHHHTQTPEDIVMREKELQKMKQQEQKVEQEPSENDELESLRKPPSDPEVIERAEKIKAKGNLAFVKKNFEEALQDYSEAIELNPADPVFYCNRSACYLELKQPEEALKDITLCKKLKPEWSKASYREGKALEALQRYEDAAYAYWDGLRLDSKNKTLSVAFQRAISLAREQVQAETNVKS